MEETDNIEISSALLQKLAAEPNPIEDLNLYFEENNHVNTL